MRESKTEYDRFSKFKDRLNEMCLMDDVFMSAAFDGEKECMQEVLRIILDKPDLIVKTVTTQKVRLNLQGHSTRFDVFATYGDNVQCDLEVQRDIRMANPKRARYYSSSIDMGYLQEGEVYTNLPESYVIFITEGDMMNRGMPMYHINRTVRETGDDFGDDTNIIYVNGAYRGDDKIGKLMHDFSCKSWQDMNNKVLSRRIKFLKENAEGTNMMDLLSREIYNEGKLEGIEEGLEQGLERGKYDMQIMLVKRMMDKGYSDDEIIGILDVDIAVVDDARR